MDRMESRISCADPGWHLSSLAVSAIAFSKEVLTLSKHNSESNFANAVIKFWPELKFFNQGNGKD